MLKETGVFLEANPLRWRPCRTPSETDQSVPVWYGTTSRSSGGCIQVDGKSGKRTRSLYILYVSGRLCINASSEEGRLCVNGMSYHGRAGENANSAVIVTVTPEDYAADGNQGPLAGVEFQRHLEERAYEAGNGKIPVQCFGDFKNGRISDSFGEVLPQMKGAYCFGNVRGIFPEEIASSFRKGSKYLNRKSMDFPETTRFFRRRGKDVLSGENYKR